MNGLVVIFLACLTAVTAQGFDAAAGIALGLGLSKNTNQVSGWNGNAGYAALGYHAKIGIPLAKAIREAETKQLYLRIAAGSAATLGQYPYQVGLDIATSLGASYCGGSILTAWRVITAAHCWWDGYQKAWQFTVVAGSLSLYYGGQRIPTSNVIMHEKWAPYYYYNDVAIVILPTALVFSKYVAAVALPFGNELYETFVGMATVSGFDRSRDGTFGPTYTTSCRKHVDWPVITNQQCAVWHGARVSDSTLCVNGAGGKNMCQGDSGGPLVVVRGGRRILIGILSFASNSCQSGAPTGFARITAFTNWINLNIQASF